jgi:hypothetical protein
VRLVAPKFVTLYRMSGKRGKNDAADVAAICEGVRRPHMRFVPIKTVDRLARLMVHRARQGFVEQRTGTIRRIRGCLPSLAAAEGGHPRRAKRTCAACQCWGPGRCGRRPITRQTRSAAGATALAQRRGHWKAVVAIAAKNARMAWAVLRRSEDFVLPA